MSVLGRIGYFILGILFAIIGITCLFSPMETFIGLSWLWSVMMIIGGIVSIVMFFAVGSGTPGRGMLMFSGIVMLLLGIMLVGNGALFTSVVATTLLQIWIIFSGIENIVTSIDMKRAGISFWWLNLILGILMTILGICTFSASIFGAALLAISVSIGLIASGISFVVKAFSRAEEA